VLHGLLRRTTTPLRAATWGALVFGAWHVVPAWRDADGDAGLAPWLVALLTFGATFVAGLGFEWLRHRGRHLAAPIVVHIATNSTPFAVAWALT
jgi:membrane protease YdiL (CAAX protease family)